MYKSLYIIAIALCLGALISCNNATDVAANRTVNGTVTTNTATVSMTNNTNDLGVVKPSSLKRVTVVLENSSTTDSVNLQSISFEKKDQHFSLENVPTLPYVMSPKGSAHASISFTVRFDAPNSAGSFRDAMLLNGNPNSKVQFDARIAMTPPDTIDINTDCVANFTSLDFDSLTTSNPMRIMSFVLTNNDSDSYMRIPVPSWSANTLSPFATFSPNFPLILAPLSSVTVSVSASKAVGGMQLPTAHYANILSFGNAVHINCTAIVVRDASNEIITTDLSTTLKVGTTIKFACHIVNRSSQPCTLTSIPNISNAGFDCLFSVVNTQPPIVIQPDAAVEVIGDLTTKATGTYTGTATFGISAGAGVTVDNKCDYSLTITP